MSSLPTVRVRGRELEERTRALELKWGDLHLRNFREPQRGLVVGGTEMLGSESSITLGVFLVVSSVPEAWKPDFISESEEAVRRISELKSYLNKHKGITSRR